MRCRRISGASSFISAGVTNARPCRKAFARAARAKLMVARGEAPAIIRFLSELS